ncbi:MAG: OmpA family protein [Bacteroidales bacterium]|nr:OmpA family protein [Bacteroidales bacterium]
MSLAQDSLKTEKMDGYFYFQPNFGATQYFGDLNKANDYWNGDSQIAFGAISGYQLSPVFGLRGQVLKADLYRKRTDLNQVFYSELWDASLNLTINVNDIFVKYNETRLVNFYLYSGAGFTTYQSTLENIEPREVVKQHSEQQHELFVPIGAGVSFRLNQYLAINLEYGDHLTFKSDGLDFTDNGKKNDHYSFTSIGIQINYKGKDTDYDGVTDKNDACPEIPGKIKLSGCPDIDNDGVADKDDRCPDEPGKKELAGCPDRDDDRVADIDDRCPDEAGKAELAGCPDYDTDGVADKDDRCPDEPGKKELAGCPDRDGDGVADRDDRCPDTTGKKDLAGCPDRDGDHVADLDDRCPDVPGKEELSGCPDLDADGVADIDDRCPDKPGKPELLGCPDRDGDGIADKDDLCPDIKGLAKFNGCRDTDGDGVPDNKDECPGVAGVISNNGCPTINKGTEIVLAKIVYFDPGSFTVIQTFRNTIILDEIVTYMKANPNAGISITGFEDANEAEYKNFHLSEKRVNYVVDYLKQRGISPTKIKKAYLGKKNPVADNNTSEGRTQNRRVEIRITK